MLLVCAAGVSACAGGVSPRGRALAPDARSWAAEGGVFQIDAAGAPARGPENGPVHIVEFGDIRCRYCKKMLPILDRVRATYPERVQTFYKW